MLWIVKLNEAALPGLIVCVKGVTLKAKSPFGAEVIVKLTTKSLVNPPPVALNVIGNVPVCVDPFVIKVKVELMDPLGNGVPDVGLQPVP